MSSLNLSTVFASALSRAASIDGVKEVSNSRVIGTWPNNGVSFLSRLSGDPVLEAVHVRKQKRERRDGKRKKKESRPAVLRSSVQIRRHTTGGVKREDRPRQQLSLEAFFYVSFDPDISLSLSSLFILLLLPFVFVVRIYMQYIVCFCLFFFVCFFFYFSCRVIF